MVAVVIPLDLSFCWFVWRKFFDFQLERYQFMSCCVGHRGSDVRFDLQESFRLSSLPCSAMRLYCWTWEVFSGFSGKTLDHHINEFEMCVSCSVGNGFSVSTQFRATMYLTEGLAALRWQKLTSVYRTTFARMKGSADPSSSIVRITRSRIIGQGWGQKVGCGGIVPYPTI